MDNLINLPVKVIIRHNMRVHCEKAFMIERSEREKERERQGERERDRETGRETGR